MSRPISISSSITFIPDSYDSSGSLTATTNYPATNGYGNSGSTTYALFSAATTTRYCEYGFSVTGIPEGSVIDSVTCVAKAMISSTSNFTTRTLQLYAGSTAKGSSTTVGSTTASAYTLSVGTWTLSELSNCKLRITALRGGSRNRSIYFYGASLLISYTYNGTAYTVTAASETTAATVSPSSQEIISGDNAYVKIETDDLTNILVEDNGVDVTNQLTYESEEISDTFTGIPTSYDSSRSSYESIYEGSTSDGLADYNSSSRICVYVPQTANAESSLVYNFDCSSIPQNAIITNVTCIAGAACYSNGQYFNTKTIQLYHGTTPKGTAGTISGTGNSNTAHNINGGSWTREELNNIQIVLHIQRGTDTTQASFSFWGARLTVEYNLPSSPYYQYEISGISADHNIVVRDYIFIPPEEDPTKTYYSLTISSINATTTPNRGTTRVESGTSETITIYPDDPQLTLVTDNGVDVSSQLVQHGGTIPTPTVTTAQGASYGFVYSSSTGYYVSNNKGVSTSAAVCVVGFNLPVRCLVTIQYINYAEATYDFGIFGNIDVPLNNNYKPANGNMPDSDYKLACNTNAYNTSSVQTITYEIPSGEHEIYIKYTKDEATDSNNDTLQFKIASIEPLETNNYYTYDLSNISGNHSLVFIFGDVSYYFVNSNANDNCIIQPDGSMVCLPGESYALAILPDETGYTVTVSDNNVDVTAYLERKDAVVEKGGVQTAIVNYIYRINSVNTGHTINVSAYPQGQSINSMAKINGTWVNGNLKMKLNGAWTTLNLLDIYGKSGGTWTNSVDGLYFNVLRFGGVINEQ